MTVFDTTVSTAPSVSHRSRASPLILGLVTVAAAMIVPYVHIRIHGADRLIDAYVQRRVALGVIPQRFSYVSRQVAENRVAAQGLMDAIVVGTNLVLITGALWLLARWRTVRLSVGRALQIASAAVWAEFAFYFVVYCLVWVVLGADGMRISWTALVPTDVASLATSGSLGWTILRALNIGAAVRFVTLALLLQRTDTPLRPRDAWTVAAGAAAIVVGAGVFFSRL